MMAHQFATACEQQDLETIRKLIPELKDINQPLAEIKISSGYLKGSPLFVAAALGFAACIPELVKAGASPDIMGEIWPQDRKKENVVTLAPLSLATQRLMGDVVETLLEQKSLSTRTYYNGNIPQDMTVFYDLAISYDLAGYEKEREHLLAIFLKNKLVPEADWKLHHLNNLLIQAALHGDFFIAGVFLNYLEQFGKQEQKPYKGETHAVTLNTYFKTIKTTALAYTFATYEDHPEASVMIAKFLLQKGYFPTPALSQVCHPDLRFSDMIRTKQGIMAVLFPKETETFLLIAAMSVDLLSLHPNMAVPTNPGMTLFDDLMPGKKITEKFIKNLKKIVGDLEKITFRDFLHKEDKSTLFFSPFAVIKQDFLGFLKAYETELKAIKDTFYLDRLEKIKNTEMGFERKPALK